MDKAARSDESASEPDQDWYGDEEVTAEALEAFVPPPRKPRCCQQIDLLTRYVACDAQKVETVHATPHYYHLSCVGEDDFPDGAEYMCVNCKAEVEAGPSRTQLASLYGADSGVSGVRVTDERIDTSGRIEHLVVDPAEVESGSWVAHEDMERSLLTRYVLSGVVPLNQDSSNDDEDDESSSKSPDPEGDDGMNQYWSYLQRGYWSLASKIWPVVSELHSQAKGMKTVGTFRAYLTELLCLVPAKALRGVMGAGLRRMRMTDPAFRRVLDRMKKNCWGHPGLYVLELCDAVGVGPNAGQWRQIIREVRAYMDITDPNPATALFVDRLFDNSLPDPDEIAEIKAGKRRKYLTLGVRDRTRQDMDTLLQELEHLISQLQDHEAVPFLLTDVGYTSHSETRIDEQQRKHRSSNKIMSLIEAVAIMLFGHSRSRIFGDVILLCAEPEHAALGEIVLSVITESYIETGRGFNAEKAGIQQRSMEHYSEGSGKWGLWKEDAMVDGPMLANLDLETDKVDAQNQELAELRQQVAELESQASREELAELQEIGELRDENDSLFRELFPHQP
ncbi:hypothetical protein DOTSEDRAFT_36583 [Dothistroma septosporum NZE10]|uniref:Uncharacterized protein n=1 Tax=Dothistroma septosporum (strain NZE10 / CBS 128990) TaxID=675120 RepID=N1PES6_DOTSN|nr:hypothetical protein DOTSEDRAFT_36583 [Dothistroma septosporum NZE10]